MFNQKSKELVTLRKRPMKDGGYSLLLDYSIDGIRTREFLKMYLVPERGKLEKLQNNETLKLALALKAKRILELQEGRSGIQTKKSKDMYLTDFLISQQEKYRNNGKPNYVLTIQKILRWLGKFGKKTTLLTIDKQYVIDFCHFMRDNGLAEGTILMYFSNLNTIFNNAYREGLMQENPIRRIESAQRPKRPETERAYLTFDEVKAVMGTKCGNDMVKAAFLFACFTGLRLSDVEALTWEEIRKTGNGWQVEAKQIKTKNLVYIPLSDNAIAQLPETKRRKGKVFDLPHRNQIGDILKRLVKRAGIDKHITFHCSRHTYATLLLTYGADIYTVSKLLGHTDVATTQIYAKIVDEKKRQAVNLIPSL